MGNLRCEQESTLKMMLLSVALITMLPGFALESTKSSVLQLSAVILGAPIMLPFAITSTLAIYAIEKTSKTSQKVVNYISSLKQKAAQKNFQKFLKYIEEKTYQLDFSQKTIKTAMKRLSQQLILSQKKRIVLLNQRVLDKNTKIDPQKEISLVVKEDIQIFQLVYIIKNTLKEKNSSKSLMIMHEKNVAQMNKKVSQFPSNEHGLIKFTYIFVQTLG